MSTTVTAATRTVTLLDLGRQSYRQTWDLQRDLQRRRIAGEIDDHLILVEHDPVYTIGRNADDRYLLNRPANVDVIQVERGGDITYHGPGQLVGYPIIDLHNFQLSAGWLIRTLETVIVNTLADFGIVAEMRDDFIGVWAGEEKIAALGVRLSRWVSMHGFALNIATDLSYFGGIVPCGIAHLGVTSMSKILEREVSLAEVKPVLLNHFKQQFEVGLVGEKA